MRKLLMVAGLAMGACGGGPVARVTADVRSAEFQPDGGGAAGWWCSKWGSEGLGECRREFAACASSREGHDDAGKCELQKNAACLTYRYVLREMDITACFVAFKGCRSYASYLHSSEPDDIAIISDCKATK